ncbi:hypothetical protein WMF38_57135 [Sorangium sp. So ce118]
MSKFTKVTEVAGRQDHDYEFDGIVDRDADVYMCFSHMVPPESIGQRGRWRITVEFEPEEER